MSGLQFLERVNVEVSPASQDCGGVQRAHISCGAWGKTSDELSRLLSVYASVRTLGFMMGFAMNEYCPEVINLDRPGCLE